MGGATLCASLVLLLAAPPADQATLVINTAFTEPVSTHTQDGVFDRVIHEAFRRVGHPVLVQQLSAERGLINANKGIDDGDGPRVGGLAESAGLSDLVQVPEAVLTVEFVPFARDPAVQVDGWTSLAQYDVAIIRGWRILERNITQSRSLTTVRNVDLLMGMLARERVDVVVVGALIGAAAARRLGLFDVRPAGPPLVTREMFLYLHRRHAALVSPLAEALRAMKSDGTYARLTGPQGAGR